MQVAAERMQKMTERLKVRSLLSIVEGSWVK